MDRQRDRKLECDMDMCRTDTEKTTIKGCHLNKKDKSDSFSMCLSKNVE